LMQSNLCSSSLLLVLGVLFKKSLPGCVMELFPCFLPVALKPVTALTFKFLIHFQFILI
jgi:hypothetical protein